ncbi:MAG: DUF4160 domain-containing protein [Caldilineaceae bacterium]|nr:DUF4160 domain-containing protein [Caldilineaceae bacterium]
MSPKVLTAGSLVFWFHSFDITEGRASIHVGMGGQDDYNDAKIWLEPGVEVAREGRTLRSHELRQAITVIEQNREFLLEEWYGYRRRAGG